MNNVKKNFDVIVVGAGHAGIEAANSASQLGCSVLIVTVNRSRIGYMSCNPSIGGLGKGHIVKEVDVLGGIMGLAADRSCIQFRRLNARKGPAVRGSRVQCDKDIYSDFMTTFLESRSGIDILESEVKRLLIEGNTCEGVILEDGSVVRSKTVILTTGTFMKAVMHFGLERVEGGRIGDKSTKGISDQLIDFGFNVIRLKTGTPPRLSRESINWKNLVVQEGDKNYIPFSLRSGHLHNLPQIQCHITYTNEKTHEIIRKNLDKSPLYCGVIEGIGPRYCPSVEDKIVRFADKDRHQTFLEPEGLSTESIYLQGISTSLPVSVQDEFLRTIPGLERVKILRAGYAVEYDCIEPTQISHTLETRPISGLFLAGQINGTSGYEEAAGQGLVAGTNAALKVLNQNEFLLNRNEAYIGVLIDDLVIKGTKEPYRMMTARAEFRLHLREDNVIERLYHKARTARLLDEKQIDIQIDLLNRRTNLRKKIDEGKLFPVEATQNILQSLNTPVLLKPIYFSDLVRRSEINCSHLTRFGIDIDDDPLVWEPVEIDIKYAGYISRQNDMIKQAKKLEELCIPQSLNYNKVHGLSKEEIEKLITIRPRTLGQISRISGVNPSAIQALMVHIKGNEWRRRNQDEFIKQ